MLKDYEIAHEANIQNIKEIAKKINLKEEDLELYGDYKAKIKSPFNEKKKGKLILVTSMNPTPYGEGKTTVAIGLHDALRKRGNNSLLTLREPSLGPVFGIKGGATGGGYAQVLPMEDINLHFNGDFHAITTANNLISAMIDNTIYHNNSLDLNLDEIYFTRTIDMNDRVLRNITVGMGARTNGIERTDHFTITAASEIMSTLCMAKDLEDLRNRLDNIIIGKNNKGEYVYVKALNITGSLLAILKEAMKPNLIQTLENNPVLMHGGPFANIAPGCNSVIALNHAASISDYVITEAGFGFDLGGFKFLDIVSKNNDLTVSGIVFVITIKALKYHGKEESTNLDQLKKGFSNLDAHLENLRKCQVPFIITLNKYLDDTDEEIALLEKYTKEQNETFVINNVYLEGGNGALELAKEVEKLSNDKMHYLYQKENTIREKIEIVCQELLHANKVEYSPLAEEKINAAEKDFHELSICIAKTQYSISDDKEKLGNPRDYTIHVKDIRIYNGAGFITVYLGNIMTMPGLSESPAALQIDVINNEIVNIF